MRNKIYGRITLGIIALSLSLSAVAFATPQLSEGIFRTDEKMVNAIAVDLDTNLLDSAFKGKQYIDENGDVQSCTEENIRYDINDMIKKYNMDIGNVSALSATLSLDESISETYDYCIPIKMGDKTIGMAKLNKGKPLNEVQEILDGLEFKSESTKEEIIKRAKEREGKWYVASIKQYNTNEGFTTLENIQSKLEADGVSNIVEMKYVSAGNFANEAIYVKTETEEFVMPLDARSYLTDVDNGVLYTINDMRASLSAVAEQVVGNSEEIDKAQ